MQFGRIPGPAQELEAEQPFAQAASVAHHQGWRTDLRTRREMYFTGSPSKSTRLSGEAIASICSKIFRTRAMAATERQTRGRCETGRRSKNSWALPNRSFLAADDHAFLLQAFGQLGKIRL